MVQNSRHPSKPYAFYEQVRGICLRYLLVLYLTAQYGFYTNVIRSRSYYTKQQQLIDDKEDYRGYGKSGQNAKLSVLAIRWLIQLIARIMTNFTMEIRWLGPKRSILQDNTRQSQGTREQERTQWSSQWRFTRMDIKLSSMLLSYQQANDIFMLPYCAVDAQGYLTKLCPDITSSRRYKEETTVQHYCIR